MKLLRKESGFLKYNFQISSMYYFYVNYVLGFNAKSLFIKYIPVVFWISNF